MVVSFWTFSLSVWSCAMRAASLASIRAICFLSEAKRQRVKRCSSFRLTVPADFVLQRAYGSGVGAAFPIRVTAFVEPKAAVLALVAWRCQKHRAHAHRPYRS